MTCDFLQCGILTSVDSDQPVQPPFKLRNFKWVWSVVKQQSMNIQATSRGSDQTARMRRLIWDFAGRTYQMLVSSVAAHCVADVNFPDESTGRIRLNLWILFTVTELYHASWGKIFVKTSIEEWRERSGSVVECLTRDRGAMGSSLTDVTALWSLSKTYLS